jgi:N-acetylmuramoyl-L-alanine amidase
MAYKVYVSPSTQEHNKGASNYGTEEENMQAIGAKVEGLLCYNGFQVRRNRPDMELKQVVEDSNAFDPDAHVAIHSNAGGGRGCEAYAWFEADGKGGYKKDTPGRRLAQAIYDEVSRITPTSDRGVKNGNHLYEIKHTVAPAALVEIAFHDNPTDAAWIKANYDAIAEAIAKGVCKYFGITFKKPQEAKPTGNAEKAPDGKLHKVQVGAFKDRANAEAMLDRLKKAGFDGFIKLE